MNIQVILDQHLKAKAEAPRNRSGKFSPSMLGRCYRAQIWNRQGLTPSNPPDARKLRIFAAGHLFHEFIQNLLPIEHTEVTVETPDFYGRADIVTPDEVIDIKSIHSKAFIYQSAPGFDIKTEKKTNLLQAAFYASTLNRPKLRIVFISKDDLLINEYVFPTSDFDKDLTLETDTLIKFWTTRETPPAEPRAYGGKECSYCSFKDTCKKFDGGTK